MFLPLTGMPILNNARSSVILAVWLPEPFLVAIMTLKSLITGLAAGASLLWGVTSVAVIASGLLANMMAGETLIALLERAMRRPSARVRGDCHGSAAGRYAPPAAGSLLPAARCRWRSQCL